LFVDTNGGMSLTVEAGTIREVAGAPIGFAPVGKRWSSYSILE
jgi:hypothetical protein